jgi:hypothetical protein
MRKLSTRGIIIFVMGLLLGTVLIGLGIALVITLKHRAMPSNSNADVIRQGRLIPAAPA